MAASLHPPLAGSMHGVAVRSLAELVGDGFRMVVVVIDGGGSTSRNYTWWREAVSGLHRMILGDAMAPPSCRAAAVCRP